MTSLNTKFEIAIAEKTEALEKATEALQKLHIMQKAAKRFPIKWPHAVTAKNAEQTALQANILNRLFARHDTVSVSHRSLRDGMTLHQIWKKVYPTNSNTASTTFRGYLTDLRKKGLVKKGTDSDLWVLTEKAFEKRIMG